MQSELGLLIHVMNIPSQALKLEIPRHLLISIKEIRIQYSSQYSGLGKIIKPLQVDVILDLEITYPRLIVSEDRKSMQQGKKKDKIFVIT